MGRNGKAPTPPNYVEQVSPAEIIERCEYLERICLAREAGGDFWLELWEGYWKRFRPLDEPWRPRPPQGSRYEWSVREQRWIDRHEEHARQQMKSFTVEM